ncbi:MAG: hypothetical protein JOZ40_22615 [Methylobacteriaceae bacterium]|nr:hypothetical protein [Methylobacteriaceae bacterium]
MNTLRRNCPAGRRVMAGLLLSGLWLLASPAAPAPAEPTIEVIAIDSTAKGRPFPHFWEQMIGSGRAPLALRESYRNNLRTVISATAINYLRFHEIFSDDLGVYDEDRRGAPIYNFQAVDQIYDGLLAMGVRPFVELGFMPKKLAARLDLHPFWDKPIVAPPKDYGKWDELIGEFARHLIARYGIDEVASWYFEVWNEPNFDFWTGRPLQETYFELYDHTARALKNVSPRLRVGGPATAATAWVGALIAHAVKAGVPIDFVSTHVYGDEEPRNVIGRDEAIPRYRLVCPAVRKARAEIEASARPDLPLFFTEFNATSDPEGKLLDSLFMGPWLAQMIRDCDGFAEMMSYWTFSDDFDERGVIPRPFNGGFGLIGIDGIPKPSFEAFRLLHGLGIERLDNAAENILITRRGDGTLVIAAWNLVAPKASGEPIEAQFRLAGLKPGVRARITRLDESHGDTARLYAQMGSPVYPTRAQTDALQGAARLAAAETMEIAAGEFRLTIPLNGLVIIEVGP